MKKLLLSLFVGLFGLIGFGSCFNYIVNDNSFVINDNSNYVLILNSSNGFKQYLTDYGIYCNKSVDRSNNVGFYKSDGTLIDWLSVNNCVYAGGDYVYIYSPTHQTLDGYIRYISLSGEFFNGCPSCPSTGEILSGYVLESSITQNYCEVEFGLITPENCPSYGSGVGTGDIMWSSFYVNDEQILGGANIYLTIPDYLKWDYTYVDQDLEIDVENEGDEEYIQGIIDINSYRPTSEDFTDIFVSGLTLVMPYIVVLLFIVFVWKLLKRIFK